MQSARLAPYRPGRIAVVCTAFVCGFSVSDLSAQAPLPATGRIEGVATISKQLTKSRRRMRIYSEPGQRAAPQSVDEHPLANVVIYLEPAASFNARAPATASHTATMVQRGERFVPYVLPVLVGTTVTFPNEDPFYHNVFSLSSANEFDLGRFPRGKSKEIKFPTPGVVQVFCHIHADMSAYILVLEHSFFVVPDAQGRFAFDDVPPGDYQLVAWHERIRPLITPIRVERGRTASLQLRIPIPEMAAR